jgi:hypothetical protein
MSRPELVISLEPVARTSHPLPGSYEVGATTRPALG